MLVTFAIAACLAAGPIDDVLSREVIGPRQSLLDTQEYVERRLPRIPKPATVAEWEATAKQIRADVLEKVVYRGEAAKWRDRPTVFEVTGTAPGGPGYRVRKLRYEVVPGLWAPALLYEPEKPAGKIPVHLAVNGHDRNGKAADYKQMRCINLAKRGVASLNVEWLNMGQLNVPGNVHYKLNQIDLCGTSGLAVFYLAMKRGLDILLQQPYADPARVAVSGLSGGGWQTIWISALDERVTFSNPVAGYSGNRTRIRHLTDLGDSEQTPCDFATVADYEHLTALRAPRPTLLTYNRKDNCCFASGHALPPLLEAAGPVFALYGKAGALRSHVNDVPGDHNFGQDNRQALYRAVGDFFFPGTPGYSAEEIPGKDEVRSRDELAVPLPENNATLHSLALDLARSLPRDPSLPADAAAVAARRAKLAEVVRAGPELAPSAASVGTASAGDTKVSLWKLKVGSEWTLPAVELTRGTPKGTTVLLHDGGRKAAGPVVERLLAAGQRVVAVDVLTFGESKLGDSRDFLFMLQIATVGGRPLGVQARQAAAAARWAAEKGGPVTLAAVGPRTSLVALVAASLDEKAIAGLDLENPVGSLKEYLERDDTVDKVHEVFCFGLLQAFDVPQIAALAAPRPVALRAASERVKKEWAPLAAHWKTLGSDDGPKP
jgi:hypothetical protein